MLRGIVIDVVGRQRSGAGELIDPLGDARAKSPNLSALRTSHQFIEDTSHLIDALAVLQLARLKRIGCLGIEAAKPSLGVGSKLKSLQDGSLLGYRQFADIDAFSLQFSEVVFVLGHLAIGLDLFDPAHAGDIALAHIHLEQAVVLAAPTMQIAK